LPRAPVTCTVIATGLVGAEPSPFPSAWVRDHPAGRARHDELGSALADEIRAARHHRTAGSACARREKEAGELAERSGAEACAGEQRLEAAGQRQLAEPRNDRADRLLQRRGTADQPGEEAAQTLRDVRLQRGGELGCLVLDHVDGLSRATCRLRGGAERLVDPAEHATGVAGHANWRGAILIAHTRRGVAQRL